MPRKKKEDEPPAFAPNPGRVNNPEVYTAHILFRILTSDWTQTVKFGCLWILLECFYEIRTEMNKPFYVKNKN